MSQFIEMFGYMETTPICNYVDVSYPGEWGSEDKDNSGVKVIRTTNFTNYGKLDLSEVVTRQIDEKKVSKKMIKKFDTILERSGGTQDNPVGRVVLFEEDKLYLCNNFSHVLRFENINKRFAFYALYFFYQNNKTTIRSMGSKTTGIQNLNMSKYLEIGVPNASKMLQEQFVRIAEQADKSKFSDFKSQFIEMFGNSKYPLKPISEAIKECFAGGDKPKKFSEVKSEEYPFPVFSNGIADNALLCYSKNYRVKESAITISARGTIGYCCIREPFFTPVVRLVTVIPNENTDIIYLYFALAQVKFSCTGAVQGQLTIPEFKKINIPIPPKNVQSTFANMVDQADKSKSYGLLVIDNLKNTLGYLIKQVA